MGRTWCCSNGVLHSRNKPREDGCYYGITRAAKRLSVVVVALLRVFSRRKVLNPEEAGASPRLEDVANSGTRWFVVRGRRSAPPHA